MTTHSGNTLTEQAQNRTSMHLIWITLLAVLASSVANLVLYALVGRLVPEVTAWPGAGVGQIIGASFVYLLFGAIAFAVVRRVSAKPARTYWIVATIGLLISLALPISAGFGYGAPGAPPAEAATVITLSLMHIVTYAISVPMFIRLGLNR